MQRRRSFHEHIPLYSRYAARVATLSPAAWDRLQVRCAHLDRPAFRALLDRAFLSARPYELLLPTTAPKHRGLRVIGQVSRVVLRGIMVASEVVAEFEAAKPGKPHPPRQRTPGTGKPDVDACLDANYAIEGALGPRERAAPGVAAAVRTAGQAVLRHDWLTPADFDAVYGFIEPEIPFAELESPTRDAGE